MKAKLFVKWITKWVSLVKQHSISLSDWRCDYIYRRFWNQMRICRSVSWISSASSMRSSRVRNDCLTNLSSIASSCARVNTVLLQLLPPPLLPWQRAPGMAPRSVVASPDVQLCIFSLGEVAFSVYDNDIAAGHVVFTLLWIFCNHHAQQHNALKFCAASRLLLLASSSSPIIFIIILKNTRIRGGLSQQPRKILQPLEFRPKIRPWLVQGSCTIATTVFSFAICLINNALANCQYCRLSCVNWMTLLTRTMCWTSK